MADARVNRRRIRNAEYQSAKQLLQNAETVKFIAQGLKKGYGRVELRKAVMEKYNINGQKAGRLLDEAYASFGTVTRHQIAGTKQQLCEICHRQLTKLLEEENRPNHNMILKYIDMIAKLNNIYDQPIVQQQSIITFKFGDEPTTTPMEINSNELKMNMDFTDAEIVDEK